MFDGGFMNGNQDNQKCERQFLGQLQVYVMIFFYLKYTYAFWVQWFVTSIYYINYITVRYIRSYCVESGEFILLGRIGHSVLHSP